MKFFKDIRYSFLMEDGTPTRTFVTEVISQEELDYITNYFSNEPDCNPKIKIDDSIYEQYKEITKDFNDDAKHNFELMMSCYDETNYSLLTLLGEYLCKGIGCEEDIEKGLFLIVKAAVHEHPGAQYLLAQTHYNGWVLGYGCNHISKYASRPLSAFWEYRAAINGNQYSQCWFPDNCRGGYYDCYIFNEDLLNMFILSANQGEFNAQYRVLYILLNEKDGKNKFFNKELGIKLAINYYNNYYYKHDYHASEIKNILREFHLEDKLY